MSKCEEARESAHGAKRKTFTVTAASRLTGIPIGTIRSWERRHGAVAPDRSEGGRRRYSELDIERLQRLRGLSKQGHAISAIAHLPDTELAGLTGAAKHATTESGLPRKDDTIVIGEQAAAALEEIAGRNPALRIVKRHPDLQRALAAKPPHRPPVVVCHVPALTPGVVRDLERLSVHFRPTHTIVVYDFAPQGVVRSLRRAERSLLQTFSHLEPLLRLVLPGILSPTGASAAVPELDPHLPRRFLPRELVENLRAERSTLLCDCPRHLSQMLLQLYDFEDYTRECRVQSPADARAHEDILVQAIAARSCLEEALRRAERQGHAASAPAGATAEAKEGN